MTEHHSRERGRWRAMMPRDLPAVLAIAALVHPDYPEDAEVFAERLRLHPAGCFVYDRAGEAAGYAIAHPWHGPPPGLNTLLGTLPARPSVLHVHDVAVLPDARGGGAGAALIETLARQARALGLGQLTLVAVHSTQEFWRRHGFRIVTDAVFARAARGYGGDARFMRRDLP